MAEELAAAAEWTGASQSRLGVAGSQHVRKLLG
jgi:hypothetical protein